MQVLEADCKDLHPKTLQIKKTFPNFQECEINVIRKKYSKYPFYNPFTPKIIN